MDAMDVRWTLFWRFVPTGISLVLYYRRRKRIWRLYNNRQKIYFVITANKTIRRINLDNPKISSYAKTVPIKVESQIMFSYHDTVLFPKRNYWLKLILALKLAKRMFSLFYWLEQDPVIRESDLKLPPMNWYADNRTYKPWIARWMLYRLSFPAKILDLFLIFYHTDFDSLPAHPSCLSYSEELVEQIRSDGSWQCIDCKACSICDGTGDPVRKLGF